MAIAVSSQAWFARHASACLLERPFRRWISAASIIACHAQCSPSPARCLLASKPKASFSAWAKPASTSFSGDDQTVGSTSNRSFSPSRHSDRLLHLVISPWSSPFHPPCCSLAFFRNYLISLFLVSIFDSTSLVHKCNGFPPQYTPLS